MEWLPGLYCTWRKQELQYYFLAGFDGNIYGSKTCLIASQTFTGNSNNTSSSIAKANRVNNLSISAYPNLVKNITTINLGSTHAANAVVSIYDLSERTLKTTSINIKTFTLDFSGLSACLYLIKYTDDNGKAVIKIQKD